MSFNTTRRWLPHILLPFVAASAPVATPRTATPRVQTADVAVTGRYVEARTASVFAGACHYNGERVTEGRSAVMAWDFDTGSFHGVSLAGVKVVGAVSCDDNLAEPAAARRSEFVVDADTAPRAAAAMDWVRARLGDRLGSVGGVGHAAITFHQDAETFTVTAPGFAAMAVRAMPDHACCSQPHLVWYEPLMPLDGRRVGFTESAAYDAGRVGDAWQRSDENSAFYGSFHD